jgi:tetratricopeptide (TPR) repeat protein
MLGDIYQMQREFPKSKEQYEKALALNPNIVGPYLGLAAVARAQDQPGDAKKYLDKVLEMRPTNLAALVARGDVEEVLGNAEQAAKDYREALALSRDFIPALNNLAYLLARQGGDKNLNEAMPLIQQAKRLAPEDPRILDTMGWILIQRKAYESALVELEEALKISPDNPTILYHLAQAYYGLENMSMAQKTLKKALAIPGNFREKGDAQKLLNKIQ